MENEKKHYCSSAFGCLGGHYCLKNSKQCPNPYTSSCSKEVVKNETISSRKY